ncbi:MAG: GAF domain-containing protein [Alphaproteobacteria bacterium]|nr:GAF domain-containing protein [Alphaproteobacteria bacterium]
MLSPAEVDALSAAAAISPTAAFEAIQAVAARRLGASLVTAMRYDAPNATVERLYSSNPAAYPVGGRKLKRDTDWSRQVLVEKRVLVCAGDEAIRAAFDDHAVILGLGIHSIVNVPLVSGSRCLGTLNVSRGRTDWTDEDIALVRMLGMTALAAVLAIVLAAMPGFRR